MRSLCGNPLMLYFALLLIVSAAVCRDDLWVRNANNNSNNPDAAARKVVFVKTHKTGSTTFATLVKLHAIQYRLVPVLPGPADSVHIYHSPCPLPANITSNILNFRQPSYDVLFHHSVLCPALYGVLIPRARAFSVVRRPLDRVVSALNYFTNIDSIAQYLDGKSHRTPRTVNSLACDMGLDFRNYTKHSGSALAPLYEQVAAYVGFVAVLEEYDKAVVLLSRYLQWDLAEMHVPPFKSVRSYRFALENLTAAQIKQVNNLNFADVYLYDRFVAEFRLQWNGALAYGAAEDLRAFQLQRRRCEDLYTLLRRTASVEMNSTLALQCDVCHCELLDENFLKMPPQWKVTRGQISLLQ